MYACMFIGKLVEAKIPVRFDNSKSQCLLGFIYCEVIDRASLLHQGDFRGAVLRKLASRDPC
jgi:hypothetical protein